MSNNPPSSHSQTTRFLATTITAGWLLLAIYRVALPVILPELLKTSAITIQDTGIIFTALFLAYALSQLPAGILTDKLGPKVLLLTTLAISGLTITAITQTPSLIALILLMLLLGASLGAYRTVGHTTLTTHTPREKRGTILGIYSIGTPAGFVLGPLLFGTLLVITSPTITLYSLAGISLITILAISRLDLHTPHDEPDASRDLPAPNAKNILSTLYTLATTPTTLLTVVATSAYAITTNVLIAYLPTYLIQDVGLDLSTGSITVGAILSVGIIGAVVGGKLTDRFSATRTIFLGLTASILTLSALAYASTIPVILTALAAFAFTINTVSAARDTLYGDLATAGLEGTTIGTLRMTAQIIGALATSGIGVVIGVFGFTVTWLVLVGVLAVGALASFSLLYLPLVRKTTSTDTTSHPSTR